MQRPRSRELFSTFMYNALQRQRNMRVDNKLKDHKIRAQCNASKLNIRVFLRDSPSPEISFFSLVYPCFSREPSKCRRRNGKKEYRDSQIQGKKTITLLKVNWTALNFEGIQKRPFDRQIKYQRLAELMALLTVGLP